MKPAQGPTEAATAWRREAERIARKINLGWWLDGLAPAAVALGVLGACALLLLRRTAPGTPLWQLALGVGGALALTAAASWLIARRRFESPEQTLVRIEASMRLRNGLSAARAGVAPWPPVPEHIDAGVRWNWSRVALPPAAALALLLGGLFVPVAAVGDPRHRTAEEPLAWQQIEADLERLGRDEILDESQLEETRKQLDELRARDESQWFSHAALEATDSLEERHASEVERLERDLRGADRALGNLARGADQMPPARKDRLLNQFDDALRGLENGALKPNAELLDQLRQLDPENLGRLDPERLRELRETLQQAGRACAECRGDGQGQGQGDEWLDELLGDGGEHGDSPKPGPGGRGGVDRGPAPGQPGVLGRESEALETGDLEALEARGLSRSAPGDLLQLEDGEHRLDETPTARRAGGAIDTPGAGGDRVWRESLDPGEQRALKRFFD